MQLVLIGTSHQTASVEIREQLSFAGHPLTPALGRLLERPGILEAVILSTCNRTEIYAVTDDPAGARELLASFWCSETACDEAMLGDCGYYYVQEDAIEHLHRVAAGVDSLIVGEGQILAQVKAALAAAQACEAAGQYLETLFQLALKAGKCVRAETDIGRGSVSVSSAAVALAEDCLGDLAERTILVYGAGTMSAHTLKALHARGAKHVYIVNRTLASAEEAAERLGGQALSLEDGQLLHAVADVIVCCTSAPQYLIGPANYPAVPGKERLLIDVAVPRNIDPLLAEMPGVRVVDLDGLEAVARHNREQRAAQIIDAEVLIARHVHACANRLASFDVAPTIHAYAAHLDGIACEEVARFLERHAALLQRDPQTALKRFASQLVGRVAHAPVANLKTLDASEQPGHAAALARLFGITVEDATQRYFRKRVAQRKLAGELDSASC